MSREIGFMFVEHTWNSQIRSNLTIVVARAYLLRLSQFVLFHIASYIGLELILIT